jgi:hypothetical protein
LPSWREIDLGHGFHETPQGVIRKKRRRAGTNAARQAEAETSMPIEDALFPRDDTLF